MYKVFQSSIYGSVTSKLGRFTNLGYVDVATRQVLGKFTGELGCLYTGNKVVVVVVVI